MHQRRSPRMSAIRGFIQRRAVVTLTLLGGVALLLGGCAAAQSASGSIALGVVGLWLAGISLLGLLTGCGTGNGSLGPGSPLTDSLPAAAPTPTPVVPVAVALRFAQQPTARIAGAQALTPITPAPQVEAIDASGNRVTSFTGSITVALGTTPPGAVLLGTTTRNAVSGVATFDDLRLSIIGTYTLQASASNLQTAVSSVNFVANPLPLKYTADKQYSVGAHPISVTVGDFNSDGNPDLAVANRDDTTVSVLLGKGDGTFNAAQTLAVASTPFGVSVGDFNGDKKTDIVTANYTGNTVSVLLGNGDGSFKAAQNIATGGKTAMNVTTADVNNDGFVDITVSNFDSNSVSVLLGNGNGSFKTAQTSATGKSPWGVVTADVNGDGNLDIITADTNGATVSVLLGNGNGFFKAPQAFPTQGTPDSVAVADVNLDGKFDIVTTNNSSNSLSVLLGNGNGTFKGQTVIPVASAAQAATVSIADLNADGKPDIVYSGSFEQNVWVLLGNGDGTFEAAQNFVVGTSPQLPTSLALGDLNKDGKIDIVTANAFQNTVSVLLHD